MKYLCIIFFYLIFSYAKGQPNLVVNPSFEIVSSCPNFPSQLNKCTGWINPTNNTPDIYSNCSLNSPVYVPNNPTGYQFANSGNNYAAIVIFNDIDTLEKEYIEATLTNPLLEGKKYLIEFYVNRNDLANMAIAKLAVLFSQDSIKINTINSLLDTPQVINSNISLFDDSVNWVKFSEKYTANGGEKYLTIGCFSNALGIDTVRLFNSQFGNEVYYFIDDVSVTLWDSTISVYDLEAENRVKVFPNPAENYFTVRVPLLNADVTIELYDVLGYMQRKEKLRSEITNFSTEQFGSGFYFYKIFDDVNVLTEGKLIIAK
jgi:hypothetical protein